MKRLSSRDLGLDFSFDPYGNSARPVLAPDGKRAAVVGREDGRFIVWVEGRRFGPYERSPAGAIPRRLLFSADSKRFAFIAPARERSLLVVDGAEQAHRTVKELVFASRGARFGAIFGDRGSFTVQVEGAPAVRGLRSAEFLCFSPDGEHHAFIARRGKSFVVLDGTALESFDAVHGLALSAAGAVGFCGRKKRESHLFVDGRSFGPFEDASGPVFDEGGRSWTAWGRRRDGAVSVLRDGEEVFRSRRAVDELHWCGGRLLLLLRAGTGANGDLIEVDPAARARTLEKGIRRVFCGRSSAIVVEKDLGRGRTFLARLGGRRMGPFAYGPARAVSFSPDGARLAFDVRVSDRAAVVLDGVVMHHADQVSEPVFMKRSGKLRWLSIEGTSLTRWEA